MARAASIGAATVLGLLLALCFPTTVVYSKDWIVGDQWGWREGVAGWEKYKPIKPGDTLVFKYDPKVHNVVHVTRDDYQRCRTNWVTRTYNSGNDHITLMGGEFLFICSHPGHCDQGRMHLNVTVSV